MRATSDRREHDMTAEATTAAPPRERGGTATWLQDRPRALLAAICTLHAIAPLIFVGIHFWYEWDETVNISQVSKQAPAGLFTAPRARGMPVLLYPPTELTTSTPALRVYLAVLSSIGLYLAFRPWLRLRPGYAVPLAVALFSSIWTAIYYGFEAMPNEYVAIGAVAATGHLLLVVRDPERRRRDLAWLAFWLVFLGLMRPSDEVYVAIPLGIAALVMSGLTLRLRGTLVAVIAAGTVLGWLEWVIEAFVSYGGFLNRLHASSAENDGGIHMSLVQQARSLIGPTLCRPCTGPTHHVSWLAVAWWFVIPPLVALGIWAARRRWGTAYVVLPTVVGLSLLFQYVVTVDYAAPRFLLPTYALLAIAVAEAVVWLATVRAGVWQPALAVPVLALGGLAHFGVQLRVLHHNILRDQTQSRLQYLTVVDNLKAHGIHKPCLVVGYYAAPVAFGAGCDDVPTQSHKTAVLAKAHDGKTDVAVLITHKAPAGVFFASWPHYQVQGPHLRHKWFVYTHPPGQP